MTGIFRVTAATCGRFEIGPSSGEPVPVSSGFDGVPPPPLSRAAK
jgi:hypothetical protein